MPLVAADTPSQTTRAAMPAALDGNGPPSMGYQRGRVDARPEEFLSLLIREYEKRGCNCQHTCVDGAID
jgi:hypothetical protein